MGLPCQSSLRDGPSVTLACSLTRRADHRADRRPRVTLGAGDRNGFCELPLGFSSCLEGTSNCAQGLRTLDVGGVRLMRLEAGRELIGLVENLLHGSWHGHYLRYFGRAGMACTMTGPSSEL